MSAAKYFRNSRSFWLRISRPQSVLAYKKWQIKSMVHFTIYRLRSSKKIMGRWTIWSKVKAMWRVLYQIYAFRTIISTELMSTLSLGCKLHHLYDAEISNWLVLLDFSTWSFLGMHFSPCIGEAHWCMYMYMSSFIIGRKLYHLSVAEISNWLV